MILSLCTCKDKEDPVPTTLPEATQSGNNTLGFMLDGERWVARTTGTDLPIKCSYKQKNLEIEAMLVDSTRFDILTINATNIDKEGLYIYGDSSQSEGGWTARFFTAPEVCFYTVSPIKVATLEITRLDTIQGIISGNFGFTQVSTTCHTDIETDPECVKLCRDAIITEGRFDALSFP